MNDRLLLGAIHAAEPKAPVLIFEAIDGSTQEAAFQQKRLGIDAQTTAAVRHGQFPALGTIELLRHR